VDVAGLGKFDTQNWSSAEAGVTKIIAKKSIAKSGNSLAGMLGILLSSYGIELL
tara:strand:+ start:2581 stop:2742 length:162 start_codon:yes stop_codon:yes gene_type:complete